MSSLLLLALPLAAQPPPRIDDEDYLGPVHVVRRFLRAPLSCELPAVDASRLSAEDFEELSAAHPGGLVLQKLRIDTEAWSKGRMLERFGDYLIQTGTGRWDRPEAVPEVTLRRFASEAANTSKSWVAKGYTHRLVSEAFWGQAWGQGNCSEPSWACGAPRIFADFDKRPTLQLGMSLASGTQLHLHEETWLALLQGLKAWWIAPASPSEEVLREEQANTAHHCEWLEEKRPEGLRFCVQQPGEVIYFGERLHATCNLADYTLGLGAQGRLPEHWSELERAMHRGHSAVVQKKLKKLKKKSLDRWLSHAVEYGHLGVIEQLLEKRADPQRGHELPPLHRAAENGHLATVQLLLERKASVRSKDHEQKEPLHHAAYNDNGHVARFLLEQRASLRALDARRLSAFASAADGGYPELMEELLQHWAPKSPEGYGAAAVHAASKGHLPVLRRLLDWRAAPQPLLAERAEFYQHRSVAEYLRGLESHEL